MPHAAARIGLYQHQSGTYHTHVLAPIHLHEADGLVRAWSPSAQAFDTLYHIHAQPGDQWRLPRVPEWLHCDDQSFMHVTGTGAITVDGTELKWIAAEVHFLLADGEVFPVLQDTIIERIGTVRHYLLPHDWCNAQSDGGMGGPFRCYQDMEIAYPADPVVQCDFIITVAEMGAQAGPHLVPNPGTGAVSIGGDAAVRHLDLFDGAGRVAVSMAVRGGAAIDLGHLAPGAYTYRLWGPDGQAVAQGRWVKH